MGPTRRRMVMMGWAVLGVVACAAGSEDRVGSTDTVAGTAPSSAGGTAAAADAPAASSVGAMFEAGSIAAPRPVTVTETPAGDISAASGVFTAAQAARGRAVYTNACARCHMTSQHSGATFAATWNNRRVFDLYDILSNTMPLDDPGSLSEQEYADVVAYILQLNGHASGKDQLPTDPATLRKLRIDIGTASDP